MELKKGTIDITTYIEFLDSTTKAPKTALAITDIYTNYIRNRADHSARTALTALALVTTAHTDNYGIEIDTTAAPGVYRIDWPDAAFLTGVDKVKLCVTCAGVDPVYVDVDLVDEITIVPLQSDLLSQPTFTSNGATVNNIEAAQNSGPTYIFAITDGDGAAVNLVGKTLWFVVHNDIGDVIFTRKTGGTGVTIGGVSGNQVTVVVTAANLANAGDFEYKLWDKTSGSELPIAVGAYVVKLCPVGS